ncbi:MAG TPA: alpha/beta family hydrolase [Jatrophihabitans sp.]|nr:alpha/beta family hydrolase [Jatrophihabitans sp.]
MRIQIGTPSGPAVVDIDRPGGAARGLLVLTHGAGGGVETADINAVRGAALKADFAVARIVQPYRVAGRSTPPAPKKQDEGWLAAIEGVQRRRSLAGLPLFVGGRSNGARVACRTALTCGAAGVVALAFPLHPPGKPDLSRLEELDDAGVPVLVVQGDRDPFGMPPPGAGREIVVIAGADHGLKRELPTIAATVVSWLSCLVSAG